ncbi:MAG TPA: carboxypeptidase-like regulatory domain-containing protein [Rhodanobacteraceae bacterium]|nr:carboxypeptidase-like regulatory domain-containing protein [Rhodanobacteraceae bacterium]
MPEIVNADPDVGTLRADFVLLLGDAFTKAPGWQGTVLVTMAGLPESRPYVPLVVKGEQGAFVFSGLKAGNYTFQARSHPDTPYYEPVDFAVTLPFGTPTWPAFPDVALADQTLPLDDAAQPAAYRAQRALTLLKPARAYPFPSDATLLRGTVTHAGNALAGATVERVADGIGATTNADGEYVLSFPLVAGRKQTFGLKVSHPQQGAKNVNTDIERGTTVVADFALP